MVKEMDKKKFNNVCITARVLLYLTMALMLYFTVYTAVVYIGAFIENPEKIIYPLSTVERVLNFVPPSVAAFLGAAAFRCMQRSETPFLYSVSKKIKAAAFWIIFGELVHIAYLFILWATGFDDSFDAGIFKLITGIILYALVYVIEQGCRLQKESDETL